MNRKKMKSDLERIKIYKGLVLIEEEKSNTFL